MTEETTPENAPILYPYFFIYLLKTLIMNFANLCILHEMMHFRN